MHQNIHILAMISSPPHSGLELAYVKCLVQCLAWEGYPNSSFGLISYHFPLHFLCSSHNCFYLALYVYASLFWPQNIFSSRICHLPPLHLADFYSWSPLEHHILLKAFSEVSRLHKAIFFLYPHVLLHHLTLLSSYWVGEAQIAAC